MTRLDEKLDNRKRVAKEVIQQIKDNKKVNISEAMRKVGYKETTVRKKNGEVGKSRQFTGEILKFTDQLEDLIQDNIKHAQTKQKKASFRDSIEAVDKLKKLQRDVEGLRSEGVMTINWTTNQD